MDNNQNYMQDLTNLLKLRNNISDIKKNLIELENSFDAIKMTIVVAKMNIEAYSNQLKETKKTFFGAIYKDAFLIKQFNEKSK